MSHAATAEMMNAPSQRAAETAKDIANQAKNAAKNIASQTKEAMAPIKRGILKGQQIGENIKATTERSRTFLERVLRSADPGDAEARFLTAPFLAPLDIVDATAGNVARRGLELTTIAGSNVRAAYRTFTRPFFHPINTLLHPFKYISNPLRLMTSSAEMVSRIINAPFRTIDELVNRGVKRPLQRFGDIPLIGKPLAYLGKGIGWIADKPRKLFEFLTSPFRKMDDWVSSKQG